MMAIILITIGILFFDQKQPQLDSPKPNKSSVILNFNLPKQTKPKFKDTSLLITREGQICEGDANINQYSKTKTQSKSGYMIMETRTKEDILRTIKADFLNKDEETKLINLVENKSTLDPKQMEWDQDKLFGYVFGNRCYSEYENDTYTNTVENNNYPKLSKFDKINIRLESTMRLSNYETDNGKKYKEPSVDINVYGVKGDQYFMMRYGNIIDADKLVELIKPCKEIREPLTCYESKIDPIITEELGNSKVNKLINTFEVE